MSNVKLKLKTGLKMQKVRLEILTIWILIFQDGEGQAAILIPTVLPKKRPLSLILLFVSQINFTSNDMTHFLFLLKYIVTLVTTKLYALCSTVDDKNLIKESKKIKRTDDSPVTWISRKTYNRLLTTTDPYLTHLCCLHRGNRDRKESRQVYKPEFIPHMASSPNLSHMHPHPHPCKKLVGGDEFPKLISLTSIFSLSLVMWYEVAKDSYTCTIQVRACISLRFPL